GRLQINSLATLSGNELGLIAYYPMDEASGDYTLDKARGANLIFNGCSWSLPDGRAAEFNGIDSYLRLNTGSSAVIDETMDYTIEFWFKAENNQTNATLVSNGRGDGDDLGGSDNLFWIGFDESGNLSFLNSGQKTRIDGDYLDNNWHHFALSVSRTIGRGQIYLDGLLKNYFDSEDYKAIASAYMYLGARAWYAEGNAADLLIDQLFAGKIDEFRVWALYKNEELIQNNKNLKLDGKEMGLLAYYPFEYYKEWQGVEELNFSLSDWKVQNDPAMAVTDAFSNLVDETIDIAPVKNKGPVSDLEFDFVVNNDALIINLRETWEKVEKTIITFTADGIRDMNGNENISPITWSAYIDRNQLKWSETEINLSKLVNDPLQFTVKAQNEGGSVQRYVIENNPSWMDIYPSSGTINPSSSVDITFEIHEGLNIGSYNEVIYLTNDNNVSEALDVNITVSGEEPDWSVDPGNFKYNMSLFGKMRFNNIFSSDARDKLAAFSKGKCIGLTTSFYYKDLDMWFAFLTIYSNETEMENIEFRMWDASTGKTYLADAGRQIDFVNNSVLGTPSEPILFDGKEIILQNIQLEKGWNWISFNVQSDRLNDLNTILAGLSWNSSNFFKSEADNVSANYSQSQSKWIVEKSLVLNNRSMYKVSSSINQTLSLAGVYILPSSIPITINPNKWTYISYLPSVRLTVGEALAGYDAVSEDVIKSQNKFAMYAQNMGWVGSLTYLEPGKGYMLKRNSNSGSTLTYPNTSGSLSTKNGFETDFASFLNPNYSGNMNMIASTSIEPKWNDRILAYQGDILNSATTVQNVEGDLLYFITLSGEENLDVSFALERDGEIIGVSNQSILFNEDAILGSIHNPHVLDFSKVIPLISVYPNPIRENVSVSVFVDELNTAILIRILDVTGREVMLEKESSVLGGSSKIRIDCSELKPGIYMMYITVGKETTIRKIEKM
ncbi:MAG: T9SS type A sorting domain-containing protein, partial [Bacteroidales bacterium]|nr:T9SS type A sorting domain-containing protein [Bacteroidales bacterium]